MKFICTRKCQIIVKFQNKDKAVRFNPGQVFDADAKPSDPKTWPPHCKPIGEVEFNFGTASRDQMLETKFSIADAKKYVQETWGHDIKIKSGDDKEDIVNAILSAKDTFIDLQSVKKP